VGSGLDAITGRVLMVGARVSALMVFAPFFGSASISPRIKAGFTVILTVLLYPVVSADLPRIAGAGAWQMLGGEFLVGLVMGIALQFVFEGVELAGQIAGFQVGHSLANLINPLSDVDTPLLANYYQMIALLIFLRLDADHWLLRGLAKSFDYCPPGSVTATSGMAELLARAAGGMLVMGVQIALPTLLVTMLIDLALGLVGRASPQLPVMLVGISVKTVVAFVVIMGTLRFWPGLIERYFGAALGTTERLLRLAR
jgi:flagellar biosynthesis protein FliR